MSLLWFPPWVSPASEIRQQGTAVSPTPELLVCLMPDNSCQQKKALSAGRIWNYSNIHKQMGAILPCKVNSSQQPECYRCLNNVMTESRGKLARSLVVPGNKSQPLWNSLGAVSEHHMKCSIPARPPWDSRAEGSAQHSVQVFHFFNILSTTLVSLSCHFCSGRSFSCICCPPQDLPDLLPSATLPLIAPTILPRPLATREKLLTREQSWGLIPEEP